MEKQNKNWNYINSTQNLLSHLKRNFQVRLYSKFDEILKFHRFEKKSAKILFLIFYAPYIQKFSFKI